MRFSAVLLSMLMACTAVPPLAHARPEFAANGAYSLELVNEQGQKLPTYHHRGRTYVLGAMGQRYLLRVRNHSGRRIEVVASVDGRDVIDGRTAATHKRGYLVDGYGELLIDGFRLNDAQVAAFRFSSVPQSYAAQTGTARDVGVVGVAVFPERLPPVAVRPWPPVMAEPQEREASRDDLGAAPSAEASAGAPAERRKSENRSGLGTQFAEQHTSHVRTVEFQRESAAPAALLSLRYNDRPGLLALGIDLDGARWSRRDAWLRETAEPFRDDRAYAQPPPGWQR